MSCALRASLGLKSEAQVVRALEGRRMAFTPIVPANPTFSASVGHRSIPTQTSTNWSFALSQEVEIAGQRGLRLDMAEADIAAERQRMVAVQRDVSAQAYASYFDVLATRDELALAVRVEAVALSMVTFTRAMADRGLGAGVDADLAEAVSLRSVQARILADGRHAQARIAFSLALGVDPVGALDASGDLLPLNGVAEAARALVDSDRPEVRALEEARRSWRARASTYRRARVPNVLLSAFVQNDGFDERVIGFGIGIPIPFPQPIGRTYAGEIAESDAMAERSATEVARVRLVVKSETLVALSEYETRMKERDAVSVDRVDRAGKTLQSIGQEVGAGRLALRDAIVAQRTLVDLLLDYVNVQHAACLASVELARKAGVPLERGGL